MRNLRIYPLHRNGEMRRFFDLLSLAQDDSIVHVQQAAVGTPLSEQPMIHGIATPPAAARKDSDK